MSRTRAPSIFKLARRLALLESLIALLKDFYNVSNRDIQRAVTKNEYGAYLAQLNEIKPSLRRLPLHVADNIKQYEERIRKADAIYFRAVNSRRPTVRVGLKLMRHRSLFRQAESAYEHALESLEELTCICPNLRSLFDRPVTSSFGIEPSPDAESVPRLKSSRSEFAIHNMNNAQSPIYHLKLSTLNASLHELCPGAEEPSVCKVVSEELDDDLLPPDSARFKLAMLDDNDL